MAYNTQRAGTKTQLEGSGIQLPEDMLVLVLDTDGNVVGVTRGNNNKTEATLATEIVYLNNTERTTEAALDLNTKVYNKGFTFLVIDTAELVVSDGVAQAKDLVRLKIGSTTTTYTWAEWSALTTETGLKGDRVFVESDGGSNGDFFVIADGTTALKSRPINELGSKQINPILVYDNVSETFPVRPFPNLPARILTPIDPPVEYMVTNDIVYRTLNVAAPTTLAVSSVSGSTFTLTWVDASDNEDGFQLQASIGDNLNFSTVVDNIAADAVTTSWNSGEAPGTTVYFRIRAKKVVGASTYYSSFSNEANDTTSSSFRTIALSQGWSLYWNLDEDSGNPSDSMGNANDGVSHNDPVRVSGLETTEANHGAFQFNVVPSSFEAAYIDTAFANRAELAFFFGFRKEGANLPSKFLGVSDATLDNYVLFRDSGTKLRIQKYETNGTLTTQFDSTDDAMVSDTIKTIGVILSLVTGDYTIIIDGGTPQTGNHANLSGDFTIGHVSIGGLRYGTSFNAYGICTIDEFLFSSNVAGTITQQNLIDLHNAFVKP